EQAAEKKQITLQSYQRPGAESGWTFLTGGPEAIREVTAAVGFRYAYVHETKEYAHPSGAIVLTPEGRVSRYFFGLSHSPRDLRLALVEASDGKIGSPVDQLLLLCYHYDPKTGKYSLAITRLLRAAGLFTLLALGTFVAVTLRRERRMRKAQ
ncbi:MAG: SCO family protein, partial [Elusimicrobia bacterium]|nr:SCO family protein [Elusimicrobiota bacterium]